MSTVIIEQEANTLSIVEAQPETIEVIAPNFVLNTEYALYRETHADRTYPVDGWVWFESEAEAIAFFGIEVIA